MAHHSDQDVATGDAIQYDATEGEYTRRRTLFDSSGNEIALPAAQDGVLAGQLTLAGTAEELSGSSVPVDSGLVVLVRAFITNANPVYCGPAAVSAANGYPLNPGEGVGYMVDDVEDIFVIGTASEKVAWTVEG